jgi:hypothetical protein
MANQQRQTQRSLLGPAYRGHPQCSWISSLSELSLSPTGYPWGDRVCTLHPGPRGSPQQLPPSQPRCSWGQSQRGQDSS